MFNKRIDIGLSMIFRSALLMFSFALCNISIAMAQAQTFDVIHSPKESKGPGIKIVFDGIKYQPPHTISLVQKGNVVAGPEETIVLKMLQAQKQGTPEMYAELWEQKLKQYVVTTYKEKPDAWTQLQQQMRAVEVIKIKGVINYGAGHFVWVELVGGEGNSYPKIFPLKKENGKLVLTNDFSDDLIYGQLLVLLKKD